jgi:hypothetical protein
MCPSRPSSLLRKNNNHDATLENATEGRERTRGWKWNDAVHDEIPDCVRERENITTRISTPGWTKKCTVRNALIL